MLLSPFEVCFSERPVDHASQKQHSSTWLFLFWLRFTITKLYDGSLFKTGFSFYCFEIVFYCKQFIEAKDLRYKWSAKDPSFYSWWVCIQLNEMLGLFLFLFLFQMKNCPYFLPLTICMKSPFFLAVMISGFWIKILHFLFFTVKLGLILKLGFSSDAFFTFWGFLYECNCQDSYSGFTLGMKNGFSVVVNAYQSVSVQMLKIKEALRYSCKKMKTFDFKSCFRREVTTWFPLGSCGWGLGWICLFSAIAISPSAAGSAFEP